MTCYVKSKNSELDEIISVTSPTMITLRGDTKCYITLDGVRMFTLSAKENKYVFPVEGDYRIVITSGRCATAKVCTYPLMGEPAPDSFSTIHAVCAKDDNSNDPAIFAWARVDVEDSTVTPSLYDESGNPLSANFSICKCC